MKLHDVAGERGSAAVETVIGVPAFLLFVGLIIFGGRITITHEAVQSAAADAARSASIARSSGDAERFARAAAELSLANQQISCANVAVRVDASGFAAPIGQPASVTVSVSCRLDLADLSVPGVPGTRLIEATMSSPLDTWREKR
ncbi:MAG: pilus assembly protein [Nocardioidaceae bacterium]|nr:pilus assembly protein [Nocardioidaceae bacterium]